MTQEDIDTIANAVAERVWQKLCGFAIAIAFAAIFIAVGDILLGVH